MNYLSNYFIFYSAYANGDPRQLGHADFYPNGGIIQTSCFQYIFISFLKGDISYGK